MKLFPVFERAAGMPRYGYNFRRQLALASARLSAALALPEGTDLLLRPVREEDMQAWRGWKDHPAMQDRHVSFHWGMLHDDDRRENHICGRRACVAITARERLCGLAHMMVSRDGRMLLMTQMEGAPGDHAMKGLLGYGVIDASLSVAQGLGCRELWLGGPFYNARMADACQALGFRPHDDGMHVHYMMLVHPETRFDPAHFFDCVAGKADKAPGPNAPGNSP
jgi:hypothetical protein